MGSPGESVFVMHCKLLSIVSQQTYDAHTAHN